MANAVRVDYASCRGDTTGIYSPLDQPLGLWRGFVFLD